MTATLIAVVAVLPEMQHWNKKEENASGGQRGGEAADGEAYWHDLHVSRKKAFVPGSVAQNQCLSTITDTPILILALPFVFCPRRNPNHFLYFSSF
ncbi:MAG: hypothetical protein QM296_11690 [Bacillota bacterium]|nr:hypothetical protein [Bacillota bacterium]